jgi:hypothetical protein
MNQGIEHNSQNSNTTQGDMTIVAVDFLRFSPC